MQDLDLGGEDDEEEEEGRRPAQRACRVTDAAPECDTAGPRVVLVVGGAFTTHFAVFERHAAENGMLVSGAKIWSSCSKKLH